MSYASFEISSFFSFVRNPGRGSGRATSRNEWIRRAIFFAILLTLIEAPILIALDFIERWTRMPRLSPTSDGLLAALVMTVIFGPIVEELIFRAGLRNPTYCLFIGPPLVVLFTIGTFSQFVIFAILCLCMSVAGGIHARRMYKNHVAQRHFSRLFLAHYARIFWLYCFLFAFLHSTNYQFDGYQSFFVFLFVLPQFISGVVMGYLRLRDGVRSSWLVHTSMNLFAYFAIAYSH